MQEKGLHSQSPFRYFGGCTPSHISFDLIGCVAVHSLLQNTFLLYYICVNCQYISSITNINNLKVLDKIITLKYNDY